MIFDDVFKEIIEKYEGPDIGGITDAIDRIKAAAENMEATVPKTDYDGLQSRYDALDKKFRERYIEENFGPAPSDDTPGNVAESTEDDLESSANAMADNAEEPEEDDGEIEFEDI